MMKSLRVDSMILPGLVSLLALFAGDAAVRADDRPAFSPEQIEYFENHIRPILVENCHRCHGPKDRKGGLRLDSRAAILKGGDTGPAIVPGKPEESELILAIRYDPLGYQMPPTGKLPEEAIARMTEWVKMGAPWPDDRSAAVAQTEDSEFDIEQRAADLWSFQPVRKVALPAVERSDWPRGPLDRFILAKLEAAGLTPAPEADRRTLIRRVTYDLIGLPPTPEEIQAFLEDDSPNAYERLVDRLLASPHYGERWARHWLDLVRFAETAGHEFDYEIHHSRPYRDYVIRAFNADVPYNQFVIEHIAGDLLEKPRINPVAGINESIIGTGFYWFGQGKHSPVDIRAEECDTVANQLDVLGKTFLGLTIACARCHDHKFDPISTKDYYALAGYLQSSRRQYASIALPDKTRRIVEQLGELQSDYQKRLAQFGGERMQSALTPLNEALLATAEWGQTTSAAAIKAPAAGLPTAAVRPEAESSHSSTSRSREEKRTPAIEQWMADLTDTARQDADDLFHPWAVLSQSTSPEDFRRRREQLVQRWMAQAQAADDRQAAEVFEDFQQTSYEDWFVAGHAFGTAPSQGGELHIGDDPNRPIEKIVPPGVAHSGLVSSRLQGVLRSRTFTIEKRFIHYRMHRRAGESQRPSDGIKTGQVHLVVDGFQLIKNPIYGGLSITVAEKEQPVWHRQDLEKWIGHKAYIEIVDDDDGWVAVDKILFSDGEAPPDAPNAVVTQILDDADLASPVQLADNYQRLFEKSVNLWSRGRFQNAPHAADHVEILNRLLKQDFGRIATSPARNASDRQSHPQPRRRLTALRNRIRELERQIPEPRLAIAMTDGTPENEYVLIRGNHKKLGDEVPRRFLEVFGGENPEPPTSGSGRLGLARQMTDPSNPLLARVMVNRLWQHHFGRGIVPTVDNFGKLGQPPTHPRLLDYLAAEFLRAGWSIKHMHRQMLLSSTYRMSSDLRTTEAARRAEEKDPENKLLHRMPIRRLEGEIIRDAILSLSGRLDRRLYGPSVPPYLTPFMLGRGRPGQSGPLDGDGRRSIYINVRRNFLTPMFLAFDYPTPLSTIGRRSTSNVPAQALTMMNNEFIVQQAELWARRVLSEPHATDRARISRLYEMAYGRPPSPAEQEAAREFLEQQGAAYGKEQAVRTWADLCHVLLNVKELFFIN